MHRGTARVLLLALLAAAHVLAQTRSLTILHTNDLHARLSPLDNKMGGFPYLVTAIRQERKDCGHCILLNAGDLAQGTPVSTIFHGLPIFEIANRLGFDAATLGNHDFDYGWMQTRKFMDTARYPIISANLVDDAGKLMTRRRSLILKVNGLRIAVIGAMTEDLKHLSTPKLMGAWHAGPLIESVRNEAQKLRPEADLIVLLAHITTREELDVLKTLPEINVIVSGHVHTGLESAIADGNRMVVRAKGNSEELGRLDLQVDRAAKAIASWKWRRIAIDSTQLTPAPDVAAEVKRWEGEVAKHVDQPLAVSRHKFEKPELKRLIEKAMREQTGADFAFMNAGGVRDILPQGKILVRNVWNVMPFDNLVVFGTFKGKDLPGVVLDGRRVDPEREYTLAVTDFTAANQSAPSQLQSKGLQFPGEGPLLRDLLLDWFRKNQTVE